MVGAYCSILTREKPPVWCCIGGLCVRFCTKAVACGKLMVKCRKCWCIRVVQQSVVRSKLPVRYPAVVCFWERLSITAFHELQYFSAGDFKRPAIKSAASSGCTQVSIRPLLLVQMLFFATKSVSFVFSFLFPLRVHSANMTP